MRQGRRAVRAERAGRGCSWRRRCTTTSRCSAATARTTTKHFERFGDSKFDWERVDRELLHVVEVKKEKPIATEARAFVHPATGLVHPVPLEWEEDLKMEKMRKTQARKRQMAEDSQTVLSSMHEE